MTRNPGVCLEVEDGRAFTVSSQSRLLSAGATGRKGLLPLGLACPANGLEL